MSVPSTFKADLGVALPVVATGLSVLAVTLYFDAYLLVFAALAVVGFVAITLKRPLVGLSLGIAMMPLEAAGRLFPGVSEITYAKVVLLCTVVLIMMRSILVRDRWEAPRFFWLLPAFWLLGAAASMISRLGTIGMSASVLIALAGQIIVVFILYNLIRNENDLNTVLGAIMLGSVPVVIFGVLDSMLGRSFLGTADLSYASAYGEDVMRVTSTFYDPNALGRFLLFAFLITLCGLSLRAFRSFAPLLVMLMLGQAYVLLNTFSRGALISLAAALALYLVWAAPVRVRLMTGGAVILTLAGALRFMPALFDVALMRFRGAFTGVYALGGRARLAQYGWRAAMNSPLIGYGPGNAPAAIGRLRSVAEAAHNLYLDTLLSVGLLGFAALFGYVLYHLSRLMVARDWTARVPVVALFGLMVMGLSLHGMKGNEFWLCIGLLAPLSRLVSEDSGASAGSTNRESVHT